MSLAVRPPVARRLPSGAPPSSPPAPAAAASAGPARAPTPKTAHAAAGAPLGADPLAGRAPLFPRAALVRTPTEDPPGNPAYAASGALFASTQTFGAKAEPRFHLGKLDEATGRMEPYPSAAYQERIGGVLGVRTIPKPKALGGDGTPSGGELLVALDWKKSEVFALDLGDDREVFRAPLPEPFVQRLLSPLVPKVEGALSFHNDLDVTSSGRFVVSNPSRGSIGVLEPDWKHPARSRFTEVLKGHHSTAKGHTPIQDVLGRPVSVEVLEVLGHPLTVPLRAGVDSIALTPRLLDEGAHVVWSPLTPDGGATLWAAPARAFDAADVRGALEQAERDGALRPVARVPVNDGLRRFDVGGRPLLFGTDVQGGGAFVLDPTTMKAAPLVRDPARVGWADGMALRRLDDDRVQITFADSGLESSLRGDAPPKRRGLYSLTVGTRELLQRLDAQGVDVRVT